MSAPGFATTHRTRGARAARVRTKLFSTAPAEFGGEPNTRVTVVDLGLPGVLPALNDEAVRQAVIAALALEGEVRERSWFDRKNYFYPDLPKGYQISQFYEPYCRGGRVPLGDGRFGQLERIHMEEDAGKLVHEEGLSLVDLNRAGTALIEIVGRPDLHEPEDAVRLLDNLKSILQYVGASDCDMEKGSLRCDANVSLAPLGVHELGTKVEIKNMNSFKAVQRALEYEERRQAAILAGGGADRAGDPAVERGARRDGVDAHGRRARRTTATSPIRTCRRSSCTGRSSRSSGASCPSCRSGVGRVIAKRSGCRTTTSAC